MTRSALCVALLSVAIPATALAGCPPANGQVAAVCDARPTDATIAACINDAIVTETCADRAIGSAHAIYLMRTASEFLKAGFAAGPRTPRGRQWLAHATVLDERVQDDPAAPPKLRDLARRDEAKAKKALFHS